MIVNGWMVEEPQQTGRDLSTGKRVHRWEDPDVHWWEVRHRHKATCPKSVSAAEAPQRCPSGKLILLHPHSWKQGQRQPHTHMHTPSAALYIDSNGRSGLRSPACSDLLSRAAGRGAGVPAVDHWSVTPQSADLTLERCSRMQHGHKSFMALCLITPLCQWSSVTTHLQVMILWSVPRAAQARAKPRVCGFDFFNYFRLFHTHHDCHICHKRCENPARHRLALSSRACTCDFEHTW